MHGNRKNTSELEIQLILNITLNSFLITFVINFHDVVCLIMFWVKFNLNNTNQSGNLFFFYTHPRINS